MFTVLRVLALEEIRDSRQLKALDLHKAYKLSVGNGELGVTHVNHAQVIPERSQVRQRSAEQSGHRGGRIQAVVPDQAQSPGGSCPETYASIRLGAAQPPGNLDVGLDLLQRVDQVSGQIVPSRMLRVGHVITLRPSLCPSLAGPSSLMVVACRD